MLFKLGGVTELGKRVKDWEGVREENLQKDDLLLDQLSNPLWICSNDHAGEC